MRRFEDHKHSNSVCVSDALVTTAQKCASPRSFVSFISHRCGPSTRPRTLDNNENSRNRYSVYTQHTRRRRSAHYELSRGCSLRMCITRLGLGKKNNKHRRFDSHVSLISLVVHLMAVRVVSVSVGPEIKTVRPFVGVFWEREKRRLKCKQLLFISWLSVSLNWRLEFPLRFDFSVRRGIKSILVWMRMHACAIQPARKTQFVNLE